MKHLITLFIVFFIGLNIVAQEPVQIIQTLSSRESQLTVLLDGPIVTKEWDKPYIQVKTTISTNDLRKEVLRRLVATNRYKLTEHSVDNMLYIEALGTRKQIIIRGKKMKENFSYEILVPQGTALSLPQPATAAPAL
jgi:hypothetical protein